MSVWRPLLVSIALVGLAAALPAMASEPLATKGACIACHLAKQKLVGPSWHDVAVKYKSQADAPRMLAERVRKGGGKNVWGMLPMPPLPREKLNDAELNAVIAWVLKTP